MRAIDDRQGAGDSALDSDVLRASRGVNYAEWADLNFMWKYARPGRVWARAGARGRVGVVNGVCTRRTLPPGMYNGVPPRSNGPAPR